MAFLTRFQRMSQHSDRYRWYALGFTTLCQAAANILSAAFGPLAPYHMIVKSRASGGALWQ